MLERGNVVRHLLNIVQRSHWDLWAAAISRLEHALSNFEYEKQDYHRRLMESQKRLAAYQPRFGETFMFEGELLLKLFELGEVEASLAASSGHPEISYAAATNEDGELIAA